MYHALNKFKQSSKKLLELFVGIKMKAFKFLSALTFIAASTVAHAKTSITVWEDLGNGASLNSAIAEFKKLHNDVDITVKEVPQELQLGKFKFAFDRMRTTPDIFLLRGERIAYAARNKLISKINFMEQDQERYSTLATREVKVDGKFYAVPRSIETLLVFYNKDLMPYPFETLSQYEQYNREVKSKGLYGLLGKFDDFEVAYSVLGAHNGYIFKSNFGAVDPKNIGLNKDNVVSNARLLSEYVKDYVPRKLLTSVGTKLLDKLFIEGKTAAVINTSSALSRYAKAGINYGVAPLPKINEGYNMTPFYDVRSYVIAKNSPNKDLCKEFLELVNEPNFAYDRYMVTAQLPPLHEVTNNPVVMNDDYANALFKQLQTAKQIPMISKMNDVWTPMSMALSNIMEKGRDPKNELDNAVANIM